MPDNKYAGKERDSYQGGMTVAGVLAGFSFTGVIALFPSVNQSVYLLVMFIAFLSSSFSFIVATIGFWAVLEWISEKKNNKFKDKLFYKIVLVAFPVGFITYLAGLGIAGFLHSVWLGAIASLIAFFAGSYFFLTAITLAEEKDTELLP